MKLYFVRHAAAVERNGGIPEEWRYLTPEGRAFFRKTAKTLAQEGMSPDLIITSPLLRAVQTADILAEALSYGGPLVARGELRPGFAMPALLKLLEESTSLKELVLVGHEPDLSSLIAALLALPGGFNFKKGAAVRLKIDPADPQGSAAFKWLAAGKKLVTTPGDAFTL
ncbi:MAG: histidine phosphatase family protein [Geobacteraceae bacterium]|nr:histidine phosphatase family protein [Geobacteraceae bacterium]